MYLLRMFLIQTSVFDDEKIFFFFFKWPSNPEINFFGEIKKKKTSEVEFA